MHERRDTVESFEENTSFCVIGFSRTSLFWKQEDLSSDSPLYIFLQEWGSFHRDNMCTGRCSMCLAVALYPLAVISIICNIVLFFPNADVKYVQDGHLTAEVMYMGGLIGGGFMVSSVLSQLSERWHNFPLYFLYLTFFFRSVSNFILFDWALTSTCGEFAQ